MEQVSNYKLTLIQCVKLSYCIRYHNLKINNTGFYNLIYWKNAAAAFVEKDH